MPGSTRGCAWAGGTEMAQRPGVVRRSLMLGTLGRLLRHRAFLIGAVLFGAMVLMAVLAPWLGSGDPNKMAVRFRFQPPPGVAVIRP